MHEAIASDKLRREHEAYTVAHCAFGHSNDAVEWGMRTGVLKGVRKPPGFSCPSCIAADPGGATFSTHGKTTGKPIAPPYHEIEIDLWGPMRVDDPNGNEVVFGGVCRATGKFFFQPLRRKSDAEGAMRALMAQVRAQTPQIQQRFQLTFRGMAIVYSDRGGEFTTTNGFTKSGFDELLKNLVHRLNTPDTPKSGTTRIERMWRKLSTAARANLYESGLSHRYFYYAMEMAADAHNQLPTTSNKSGNGEAPDETLGLYYDLMKLVPFGSKATLRVKGDKADDKTEVVFVLGFNPDGPGYRVLRKDGKITASIHVKVTPEVATKREYLEAVRKNPLEQTEFVQRHIDLVGTPVDTSAAGSLGVQDISVSSQEQRTVQRLAVQEVGAHPGHGGSRTGLVDKAPTRTLTVSTRSPVLMTKESADALIANARAAGMVMHWQPTNPKTGRSQERYELYSKARTFSRFDK